VATFYKFVRLEDPAALVASLQCVADKLNLKGTILVASEGINGTLAGDREQLAALVDQLLSDARFADMPIKYSTAQEKNPVFHRLKVRLKEEIVALKQPGVDVTAKRGTRVDAATWNQLLDDPQVLVIDARNRYEIAIGSFAGAVDPNTRSFREFPGYVASALHPTRHPRVAMFCTGGVRCEKASAYLLQQGFEEVYQLDGGVLKYLETVGEDNRFEGECFVFDQRVSVTATLDEGQYVQCHACRAALSEPDVHSPAFEEGVSCPHCIDELTEAQKASFRERQRQVLLANARGERHVGASMP
jgi:UPF0176 protein